MMNHSMDIVQAKAHNCKRARAASWRGMSSIGSAEIRYINNTKYYIACWVDFCMGIVLGYVGVALLACPVFYTPVEQIFIYGGELS
jgi:hypothetical protein